MAEQQEQARREMVREALRQIDDLQRRLATSQAVLKAPIAIIGIGCRYPGGITGLDAFWRLLASRGDAITEVPAERWRLADWYDPDATVPGKTSTRWGGFMDDVDKFDADFFGITPREAALLDPQHRIALEVAHEALEHAGRSVDDLLGSSTGVFLGMTTTEYQQELMGKLPAEALSPYLVTGNVPNAAAGRIAYSFGLQGPSAVVDTACSSSLTAIHLACQSLRAGDCDAALAGGVNVILAPQTVVMFSKWGMMAPDGRCKTFDAAANGFVRSEGCAMLALKRLDDALADGDRVLAVIEGSAINQDGRSSGLTVPNGRAQEALIRKALANAGVSPADIDYVEAHGTGTSLGDPIELDALGAVFAPERDPGAKLRIGSVKTNLGHTEAASGIAGLIKCVLAFQHETIPAQLHFREPTPNADWEQLPFEVVADPAPWPRGERKRRAGISSFGFSGGNAHVVLAEPPVAPAGEVAPAMEILTLSARDPAALTALAGRYAVFLRETGTSLADICFTANTGRARMNHRLFVCGDTRERIADQLERIADGSLEDFAGYAKAVGAPKIGFLFTGQGSQYPGMGRGLYESQPPFRRALDRCAEILATHLDRPLLDILFAAPGEEAPLLNQTRYTQPALFALEWALAELWRHLGITPSAMLGHSLGEYVAACQAGVLTLEDGLRLVAKRAELMQTLPPDGMMAAVSADAATIDRFLAPHAARASIAAENGPRNVVLSGYRDAIDALSAAMAADGLSVMRLNVSHAFHSPAMDPVLDEFERLASGISYGTARIPVVSNLTGRHEAGKDVTGVYWRRHLRERVRFAEGFAEMRRLGCDAFVEIGPDPVLTSMARRIDPDTSRWLPSLARGSDDQERFLRSLGELFIAGARVDWERLYDGRQPRRCALPTYPFQRKRFWVDAPSPSTSAGLVPGAASPLVAERVFSRVLGLETDPDLADHVVGGEILVPMTAFLTLALDAARAMLGQERVVLEDIVLAERAVLRDDRPLTMQVVLSPDAQRGDWTFRIIGLTGERSAGYILHVSGRASPGEVAAEAPAAVDAPPGMETIDAERHIEIMRARGLTFGPAFQGVVRVRREPGTSIGDIERDAGAATFSSGLLDVCLQPLIHAWPDGSASGGFLPFAVDRVEILGRPTPTMRSFCRASAASPGGETMTGDVTVSDDKGNLLVRVGRLAARATGGAPDRGAVDALLYERVWLPVAEEEQPARAPTAFHLPEAAERTIAGQESHVQAAIAAGYSEALTTLNQQARAFIVAAMGALGWSPDPGDQISPASLAAELGVRPRYEALLGRFLDILADDGLCERNEAGWAVARPLPKVDSLPPPDPARAEAFAPELRLLTRCGVALPRVLRGEVDPLELLFGQAAEGDLDAIYAHSLATIASNKIAADLVAELGARVPDRENVSILEIGAGTGGTTAHVLERLGARRVDYCFTDVGPALVSRARQRFRDRPGMTFEVLDIEQDLAAQGFTDRRVDIVVAANVLHATRDLTAALVRARQLLKTNGVLVLIEGTQPEAWIDVTFGLTDGWWKFTDRDVRADYPLIAAPAWMALLEKTGFATSLRLDGPAAPGRGSSYTVLAANSQAVPADGAWLLFTEHDDLPNALRERGEAVITVRPGDEPRSVAVDEFVIRPDVPDDYGRLLEAIGDRACAGVVHAWLGDRGTADRPDVAAARTLGVKSLLHLSQALVADGRQPGGGLWIVSRGAQAAAPDVGYLDPAQALAWGFGKTLGLEHPELKVRRLDLDPAGEDVEAVADLLLERPSQAEWALRAHGRYQSRVERWRPDETQPVRLLADESGSLESLSWRPAMRPALGARDVEIRVEAAALNFRDVLRVLNMYAGATGDLGGEVAGTVVAVGADVRDIAVGDTVGAIAFGGFNSFVTTDAALVLRKPEGWSLVDVATIPSTFCTAHHAIVECAEARAGERVLIHTATGGVGLAAIQVARAIGCEIVATAGSEKKRDYLRRLGIAHVFDSRSTSFADDIRAVLDGGVDVIVNTLGAEFTNANLAVLAERGRFVELGRRELWDPERIAAARPAARYFMVDLAQLASQSPEEIGSMLEAATKAIAAGDLAPLPATTFPPDRAKDAFRLMAQARHVGKVIVALPRRAMADAPTRFVARPDRGYLVTGGLGGLGLETAKWLVERGAKHLALFARSPADAAARDTIDAMRAEGVAVLTVEGDVADSDDVARLFATIREKLAPLAGIIHSAGILDDGAIANQSWSRIERVLRPKRDGTWNLHVASAGEPLDLFVCYSSASAILGSPGQANHAAANAYQDALMHYRRALGLAGSSINWGAWSAIGAAANTAVAGRISTFGVEAITPAEGLAALERLILAGGAQAMVVRVRWDEFLASARPRSEQAPFAGLGAPTTAAAAEARQPRHATLDLARLSGVERRMAVLELIRSSLAVIIGLEPDAALDPHRALRDLGLDSLMSVELRNRLQAALGQTLPATLIFDFPTVAALVDHVAGETVEEIPTAAAFNPSRTDEMSDIADLSTDEAEAALMEELARTREYLQ